MQVEQQDRADIFIGLGHIKHDQLMYGSLI
jgi:hypothetical protein